MPCTREAEAAGYDGGFDVMISIEGGEEAAKRTFNPHIGVEGGLSVLGTSGIVEPMSQQAVLDTVQLEIHQAALREQSPKRLILPPATMGWTTWPKTCRNTAASRWSSAPTLWGMRWIWPLRSSLQRYCWWGTSASWSSWRAAL